MSSAELTRVLLVEDDHERAAWVKAHLGEAGGENFALKWVTTFEQGLEQLQRGKLDVAILDSRLDGRPGTDLLAHLPDETRTFPVIMLGSGGNSPPTAPEIQLGVADCIELDELNPRVLLRSIRHARQNYLVRKELREHREWFEGIFNAVSEGILVHDGQHVLDANAAFLHMVGRAKEEVFGSALATYFSKRDLFSLSKPTSDTDMPREMPLRGKRHRIIPAEVSVRSHAYQGKTAFLVTIRENTLQKRAEAELMRINRELEARVAQRTMLLERTNRELERFAEIVAHDIRAPLAAVAECLQEARARHSAEAATQEEALKTFFVERALTTVERVRDLVKAVLTYSRITAESLQKTPVNLQALVEEVLSDLHERATEKNATVKVGALPEVPGAPSLLADLFRNLIDNAIKYSNVANPVIEVLVHDQAGEWVFSVSDNGNGFDPADAQVIFDMFFRAANSSQEPGAGIGLATCKKIVQLHGGRIWATSEPGRGACFSFTLETTT